jgi:hypothetical protein
MIRNIVGPKRDEVSRYLMLHNEKLRGGSRVTCEEHCYDSYIKEDTTDLASCFDEGDRNAYKMLMGNRLKCGYLEGRISLRRILGNT